MRKEHGYRGSPNSDVILGFLAGCCCMEGPILALMTHHVGNFPGAQAGRGESLEKQTSNSALATAVTVDTSQATLETKRNGFGCQNPEYIDQQRYLAEQAEKEKSAEKNEAVEPQTMIRSDSTTAPQTPKGKPRDGDNPTQRASNVPAGSSRVNPLARP
jgi:hypothetical protein